MLYDETAVRANIRNREGSRVFFLGREDCLTPSARDYLNRERIRILPAEEAKPEAYRLLSGGFCREKPEHMTHLNGETLVPKTHPRIRFRGQMDLLEAELLLCKLKTGIPELDELLKLARRLIRCDVLEEAVGDVTLCGMTEAEQRRRSHFPQEFYGQPHFMPEAEDGERILLLNRCRCVARAAELAACEAFQDRDGSPTRGDLLLALNRMSSMLYILMIREKADT